MTSIFRRPELAARMAQQLLKPGVLDEGLRSGLFLSGVRRTGKTTFLLTDLIPALEQAGAVVIYVDLWSDTQTSPTRLLLNAVKATLAELQTPGSRILKKLRGLRNAEVEGFGFKFGFKVESVGKEGGTTLAQALTEVVDQAKANVVLIVDEVQHAITTDDGNEMLLALKAARDAINARPATPGHFIFIGTGSHRAMVSELTARRNQAFAGATSVAYPVLEGDYVQHVLNRLAKEGARALPSLDVAIKAFATLGNRPEELLKALRLLQGMLPLPAGDSPDQYLGVIAATVRSSSADTELARLNRLGGLAVAIFERIASTDGDARGLFSAEAAAEYSRAVGREVRVEETQPVVNELLAANLIMRKRHGWYGVADPFIQEIWQHGKRLKAAPESRAKAERSGKAGKGK